MPTSPEPPGERLGGAGQADTQGQVAQPAAQPIDLVAVAEELCLLARSRGCVLRHYTLMVGGVRIGGDRR